MIIGGVESIPEFLNWVNNIPSDSRIKVCAINPQDSKKYETEGLNITSVRCFKPTGEATQPSNQKGIAVIILFAEAGLEFVWIRPGLEILCDDPRWNRLPRVVSINN